MSNLTAGNWNFCSSDDSISRIVWQSFDYPTHTLFQGNNVYLTSWFIIMLAIAVATLLVVGLLFFWKHKAICLVFNQKDITGDQLVAYSSAQTKNITKNFYHKLGEGGFGSVFKGSLPNSTVVAVK
ncbi:G-type lectin S-receptor-like serine/threonine-protein kinase [Carex littledalei]|uniref:G-type lectin S-receptor-like serine/threonine-protein kinase n=1 Tax=Carex littledalei TaxID=544730 RepID=A0A833R0N9_9POAL|nr:G-type lectin S-receptor-like serine/threonine-protein kinase [Carex littledalei]